MCRRMMELKAVACHLEISMSCVTEAEDEDVTVTRVPWKCIRYRKSRACMFDQVKGAVFKPGAQFSDGSFHPSPALQVSSHQEAPKQRPFRRTASDTPEQRGDHHSLPLRFKLPSMYLSAKQPGGPAHGFTVNFKRALAWHPWPL